MLHLRELALAAAGLHEQQAGTDDRFGQPALVDLVQHLPHRGQRARIEARLLADHRALVGHLQRQHVAVHLEERGLAGRVAEVAIQVERGGDVFGDNSSARRPALSRERGRR